MKIGVLGLGLIGGSIFKSLSALGYDVVGISKSQADKLPNIYDDREKLVGCDLVFVCSPMNKVLNDLRDIEQFLSSETVVTDVSSLKEFVSKEEYKFNFVPSHPMAGTEFSGFENSFDGLFKGAKWVLTPKNNEIPDILVQVIEEMGAKVVITNPQAHDEAAAMISHMPMVVAQALFSSTDGNDLAKTLASSGFRDMTRLALSSEEMACDMVSMNCENIQKALLRLYSNIGELIKENYPEKIHKIKLERAEMYKDGVNIYSVGE